MASTFERFKQLTITYLLLWLKLDTLWLQIIKLSFGAVEYFTDNLFEILCIIMGVSYLFLSLGGG